MNRGDLVKLHPNLLGDIQRNLLGDGYDHIGDVIGIIIDEEKDTDSGLMLFEIFWSNAEIESLYEDEVLEIDESG